MQADAYASVVCGAYFVMVQCVLAIVCWVGGIEVMKGLTTSHTACCLLHGVLSLSELMLIMLLLCSVLI